MSELQSLKLWINNSGFQWKFGAFISFFVLLPVLLVSILSVSDLIETIQTGSWEQIGNATLECLPMALFFLFFLAMGEAISTPPAQENLRRNLIITDLFCFGLLALLIGLNLLISTFSELSALLIVPVAFSLSYIVRSVGMARKYLLPR